MTQLSQNAICLLLCFILFCPFWFKHGQFTVEAVKTLNDVEAAVNRQYNAPHSPLFYFCTFPIRESFSSHTCLNYTPNIIITNINRSLTNSKTVTLSTSDAGAEMCWRSRSPLATHLQMGDSE
ncbi:hypothetical protein BLNAU_2342 [Blattamonas nauphoetae]|uniref:Uncharacterized protein n=1 Tax=Blattamonas nauphoetae TaxID=2049346 RepID=A0ABQ9YFR4_9EUKA|nr:hypothetical protein BLNAU_2342 [Blattamonas nauphoetae]